MVKVVLLIIAYTLQDGSLKMSVMEVDACPSPAETTLQMEPLKEAGYLKSWAFWCNDTYLMPKKPKGA